MLDHWVGDWVLGFPVFQYYQHLPHVTLAAVETITGADTLLLLRAANVLAVALFPLAMFVALRWLDVPMRAAALAALVSSLLSTPGLSGFDAGSYLWRGAGLYTQAWGMCLLPLAIAAVHRAITTGRGITLAAALLATTLLSHLVYGWIAVVSAIVLTCVARADLGIARRAGRLGLALVGAAVAASYFLVPYVLNRASLNRSVWEAPAKYDSFGHAQVLEQLVTGQLLDAGRLPVLTVLLVIGIVVAARRRAPWDRALLALLITWVLLFFGRPTWGVLLDLLPGSRDMHFHRLIAGVHLAAIPLIGIGLESVYDAVLIAVHRSAPARLAKTAAAVVVALILIPALVERARYVDENRQMMATSAVARAEREADVSAVIATLEKLQTEAPARVYAGLPGGWGGRFAVGSVPMYTILSLHGFPTLGYAYHAMSRTADVMYHFDETRRDHYDVFGVGYVVAPGGQAMPAFLELVGTHGPFSVHRVRPVGYVAVVQTAGRFTGSPDHLYRASSAWLASQLPAWRRHPALERRVSAATVAALTPAVATREPGRVIEERIERQGWSATVDAQHPAHVLVKTTHHPWWRAEVDGVVVATVALTPGFVGIPVSAGEHRLRVEYRVPWWKTALAILGPLMLVAFVRVEGRALNVLDRPLARVDARLVAWRSRVPDLAQAFGLGAITLVAGLPLLQDKLLAGHDAPKYPVRAALVWQALRDGEIFPRWAQALAAGYGEPAPNFTPPLVSYAAAGLHALSLSLVASVNVVTLLGLFVAVLGMWLLARDLLGPRAAPVAAVAYLMTPYVLLNVYVRADHSEFAALALLPLLAWSVLRAVRDAAPATVARAAVVLGAFLLASAPVALIATPIVAAGGVALAVRRDRRSVIAVAVVLALGVGLAAFYALPAFVERHLVQTERAVGGWWDFRNHFVPPAQLVWSEWRYAYNDFPSTGRTMSFALGAVHWVALAFALVALGRRFARVPRGVVIVALLVAAFGMFMTTEGSRPLWEVMPVLRYVQFPWRFLLLVAPATALLCALPVALLPDRRYATVAGGALIAALLVVGLPLARPFSTSTLEDGSLSPDAIRASRVEVTSVGEFRPRAARVDPPLPAMAIATIVSGPARIVAANGGNTRHALTVEAAAPALVRLNVHDFPGWGVAIDDRPAVIRVTEPEGLIEIGIEAGTHRVEAVFRKTRVRVVAETLSLVALALVAGAVVAPAIRRSR